MTPLPTRDSLNASSKITLAKVPSSNVTLYIREMDIIIETRDGDGGRGMDGEIDGKRDGLREKERKIGAEKEGHR